MTCDRFEQMPNMIADIEASDDAPGEPRDGTVEYRQIFRSVAPIATVELVDAVAGLAAEKPRQLPVFTGQQVHGQVCRTLGDPEGVILLREPDQET